MRVKRKKETKERQKKIKIRKRLKEKNERQKKEIL